MKFKKIILENFGIYNGINEFDLNLNNKKNIILIGGKNGNGKTTLFTSIKLCLYGIKMFDKILSKKEYEQYLYDKIHRNPNQKIHNDYSKIKLIFDFTIENKTSIFEIERYWENSNNKIKETFSIYQDGSKLKNLNTENWQDFINNIIPKGLSQLFFFDGEKIQNLVDDKIDNTEFSNSFKALLGLENVEKLNADLEIYKNKQLKKTASKEIKNKLLEKEKELKELEHKLERNIQYYSAEENNYERLQLDIENLEEKIKNEGGIFASKREKLKEDIREYETKLNILESNFRDKCSKVLPFDFSKELLSRVVKRIKKEEKHKSNLIASEIIEKRLNEIKNKFENTLERNKISNESIKNIYLGLKKDLIPNIYEINTIHNYSDDEKNKIISTNNFLYENKSNELEDFSKEHNKLNKKLLLFQKELSYAASDEQIGEYVKKVNELNQKLNESSLNLHKIEEENKNILYQKTICDNECSKIRNIIKEELHSIESIEKIENIQKTLKEYYDKIKNEKLNEFRISFIENFNSITRKRDAYKDIKINPNTFSITLIKSDNSEIPKSRLSEGEKQMYALTVLWTLTKISNRNFPFIIDTPLGRLDHSHRSKLIKTFFPKISEQLIILSTDSEIDSNYHNILKENIAQEYLLSETEGSTKVEKGYFF